MRLKKCSLKETRLMNIKRLVNSLILFLFLSSAAMYSRAAAAPVNLCCNNDNNLYAVLRKNDIAVNLYGTPREAILNAPEGTGVLILAESYPRRKASIDSRLLRIAQEKELRLYVEFPSRLAGLDLKDTVLSTRLERGVVLSDVFGKRLPPMSILGINGCHIIPSSARNPLMVLGRVAGLDKAIYGLDSVNALPLLFRTGNMMVATSSLSDFATGRYEPESYWRTVWQYILSWVSRDKNIRLRHWLSYVSPMYGRNQPLPANAMQSSIREGVRWFFRGHFFIAPSWQKMYLKYQGNGESPYGPPVKSSWPNGNGSLGILEGEASHIYYNGTQEYRYWVRSDNQGQVAYALAAAGHYLHKKDYYRIATNLGNFIFYHSDLRSGLKNDRKSPVYGLIGWATTHPWVFYEDDNARVLLGMIGAEAYLHTDRWDKKIAEGIMANFRTTGREGFRGPWLSQNAILKNGWKHYWDKNVIDPNPHYEGWMWACYLWLYGKTGYKPLLTKTETAIRITMQDYPDKWIWSNSMQQERARMILPLAWLVRVDNTPLHRKWLNEMVTDLLKYQAPCGAIPEELGPLANGLYPPPKSNPAYGTKEAPLIFKNGEPVADMLYTDNFAFFALNEAAHATKNKKYMAATRKLADFLIRIQVRSTKFKDLDGGWFRAFDYGLWDYWASNSDAGWGAWSTNTGWIQSWIICTDILLEEHQSFWSLTGDSRIGDVMPQTVKVMFGTGTK